MTTEPPKATTANLHELFNRLIPDPDQPDTVAGPWKYASMVDAAFEVGVWEAPIDTWREAGYPVNEFVVIISGHLRLTEVDGTVLDLRAGDLGYIPKGWTGTWEVLEPVRKTYVVTP
ncbi:MAG: cupin domain-containing protein [Actinomycetota bacterium]